MKQTTLIIQVVLLFLLIDASAQSAINKFPGTEKVSLNGRTIIIRKVSSKDAKSCLQKAVRPVYDPVAVKKIKNVIRLKLMNGKYIILRDDPGKYESEQKVYTLEGSILNKYYVVYVHYYDWGECLLINKGNGSIIKLWDVPHVSTDNAHLATFCGSLAYDVMPNGIQLYKITSNSITLEWEYKIQAWQPDGICWKNKNTLFVSKVIPDCISPTGKEIKTYVELNF